jgi:rhodanese-related sulfurtransferase
MIEKIYTPQFLPLIGQSKIVIVDVREDDEFAAGHIPGAVSLPLSRFQEANFPDDCDIVFYCRSGYRSQIAIEYYCSHKALSDPNRRYMDYKDGYLGYVKSCEPQG